MYKASLCSRQEIPPRRSCFTCSELLHRASEGAPATPAHAQVGEESASRQASGEGRNPGGLRSPALAVAVLFRAAGCSSLPCRTGSAHRAHPSTRRARSPCSSFWLKATAQSCSWTFYSVENRRKKGVNLLISTWAWPFKRRSGRRLISLPF